MDWRHHGIIFKNLLSWFNLYAIKREHFPAPDFTASGCKNLSFQTHPFQTWSTTSLGGEEHVVSRGRLQKKDSGGPGGTVCRGVLAIYIVEITVKVLLSAVWWTRLTATIIQLVIYVRRTPDYCPKFEFASHSFHLAHHGSGTHVWQN